MSGATLVVGDLSIGDMILSHGFLQQLKDREPDCPIDVVATKHNAAVPLLFPEVRKVLIRPVRFPGRVKFDKRLPAYLKQAPRRVFAFLGLTRQIKRGNYSKAYILRFNPKDAWGPYFARVPERIGHLRTKNSQILLTKSYATPKQPQHRSRSIAMLGYPENASFEVPTPVLSIPADAPVPLPSDLLPLVGSGKLIAFCPGGTSDNKKWPAESFGKLAAWLLKRGFQTIILGASEDQAIARRIVELSPASSVCDLTGRFDLMETMTVLSHCHALVSNDTGPMHAAAALGIITLGIFMITNPVEYHPLGTTAHYISTYVESYETDTVKPYLPPPPDQVIDKLDELL